MKKKDLNKIAKLEKLIKEKYGEEVIRHPLSNWNEEKEKKYLEELRLYNKQAESDKEKIKGFLVPKRLIKNRYRTCELCNTYSFKVKDDVYMIKYGCCYSCFVLYIEGREGYLDWNKRRKEIINENSKKETSSDNKRRD